jgi:hypothetical protein
LQRTHEARWFFAGRPTAKHIAWFIHGKRARREVKRTDRYLHLGRVTTLGLKLRQGKLEVKLRATAPSEWVKWSLPAGNVGRPAGRWLALAKQRIVLEEKGCDIELARIAAFGRHYFSLGFEATSGTALGRALARFFASRGLMPAPGMKAGRALSYPAWLASVAPVSARPRRRASPAPRARR